MKTNETFSLNSIPRGESKNLDSKFEVLEHSIENADGIDYPLDDSPFERIQLLAKLTYEKLLSELSEKYPPLGDIYFIYEDEIRKGIVLNLSPKFVFQVDKIVTKFSLDIALSDGTIVTYPYDIKEIYTNEEDLLKDYKS